MNVSSPGKSAPVAIVVGGHVGDDRRREVAEQKRPRIDVLEMSARWNADIYDFSEFRRAAQTNTRKRLLFWIARKTGMWSLMLVLAALPKLRAADTIYATGEDVGFPLGVLLSCLRLTQARLVVRLEQPTYGRTPARQFLFNLYMRAALKRVHVTVCRTTSHLQYLASVHGVPLTELTFTPETTDPSFYRSCADGQDMPRMRDDNPFIVSAGMEMRDYDTLIRAMEGLPVRLVIGAGSPWSHFRWNGEESALPDNVEVSSFSPRQMRALYQKADFVVVPVKPTLRACGMNVVLEAWASGKGVIVTRTAGQLDYARDGENALFVNPEDAEDMRKKIGHLLQNPEEARRLGQNGRRYVEEQLNLDRYIEFMSGVLFSMSLAGEPLEIVGTASSAPVTLAAGGRH